jgi:hypothetical protein
MYWTLIQFPAHIFVAWYLSKGTTSLYLTLSSTKTACHEIISSIYIMQFSPSAIYSNSKPKLLYDWRSVSLGVEPTLGLVSRYYFLSERCCLHCSLVSVGSPLRREDGFAVCSAMTQWSGSRRTCNHTSLSHLRLPQPGGPTSLISCDSLQRIKLNIRACERTHLIWGFVKALNMR